MKTIRSLNAGNSKLAALTFAVTTLSVPGLAMAAMASDPYAGAAQVDVVAVAPATEAAIQAPAAAGSEAPTSVNASSDAAPAETTEASS